MVICSSQECSQVTKESLYLTDFGKLKYCMNILMMKALKFFTYSWIEGGSIRVDV